MTDSKQAALLFSNLGRKKIHADFVGGKLTRPITATTLLMLQRYKRRSNG